MPANTAAWVKGGFSARPKFVSPSRSEGGNAARRGIARQGTIAWLAKLATTLPPKRRARATMH